MKKMSSQAPMAPAAARNRGSGVRRRPQKNPHQGECRDDEEHLSLFRSDDPDAVGVRVGVVRLDIVRLGVVRPVFGEQLEVQLFTEIQSTPPGPGKLQRTAVY
ncbi:hypothetical protein ACFQ2Y_29290 [Streptomyces malaysiensis subsp. malaysiensis]